MKFRNPLRPLSLPSLPCLSQIVTSCSVCRPAKYKRAAVTSSVMLHRC